MANAHCVDQVKVYAYDVNAQCYTCIACWQHGGSSSGMREYVQMLQVSNGLMLNMTAHIALGIVCCQKASCH